MDSVQQTVQTTPLNLQLIRPYRDEWAVSSVASNPQAILEAAEARFQETSPLQLTEPPKAIFGRFKKQNIDFKLKK